MRASSVEQFILETLACGHAHLNSQQIYEEVRKRLPALNPSTVYRALDRLVKRGQVSISDMGTGSIVYELLTDELHHHLVCQCCGRALCIENEGVQEFFDQVQSQYGFQVATRHLILFGMCSECQAKA